MLYRGAPFSNLELGCTHPDSSRLHLIRSGSADRSSETIIGRKIDQLERQVARNVAENSTVHRTLRMIRPHRRQIWAPSEDAGPGARPAAGSP